MIILVKIDKLAHTLTINVNSLKNLTSGYLVKTKTQKENNSKSNLQRFTEIVKVAKVNYSLIGIKRD